MSDVISLDDIFSDSKKLAAFNRIAEVYYNHNFGSYSKTDIDLLMFDIYLEAMIEKNKNADNTINYSEFSDYKIGVNLGITPQRVKALKVKKELKYPQKDFNWHKSLVHLLSDPTRIHCNNDIIKVNIPDPNLFYAIKDEIEDMGGYIDIQLNSSILQVHKNYLIQLIYLIAEE